MRERLAFGESCGLPQLIGAALNGVLLFNVHETISLVMESHTPLGSNKSAS